MGNFTLLISITLLAVSTCFAAGTSRSNEATRKRGWGDFWNGSAVGTALATAALAGKRNVEKETSNVEATRKRGWGKALVAAALVGKRNVEKESSRSSTDAASDVDKKAVYVSQPWNPPPFVSGVYREAETRAANAQRRLQKRIHWGHALAGAATGAGVVLLGRDGDKRGEYRQAETRAANAQSRLQKRIHWGHALAGAATGAGVVLLGRDGDKRGEYRHAETRAANAQSRLQKRIHWGHALAGAATGAGVVLLGRDGDKVRDESRPAVDVEKKMASEPWGLNPGYPPRFNIREEEKKASEPDYVHHRFQG